jgi:hypothetical protein
VTAVYILNHSPTKALNGMTPYEAWHGRKPVVSHLRVFGCLAFTKELGHIGKLDNRSNPGVFIGYAEDSKAYRILDPGTLRVHTARDVGCVWLNVQRGMEWGGHVFYSVWLRVKRGRGEHRSDFWGRRDPKKLRGRWRPRLILL